MSPLHSRSAYVPRGIMPHLRLLGPTELETDAGRSIDRLLAQPKSVALLAFLAAAGNGFHRRDRLVGLFWPEMDDRSARRNLRGRIHLLRKFLGDDVVVSRGDDEVGLDPDRLGCDVWEFEDAMAAEEWERALELYRGNLLEGFHLNGDGVFLHWLDGRRTELRAMAAEAARSRSREAERAGDLRAAVDAARRLVGLAPTDEVAVRRLLILLDASGDRAGVAAAFEAFERRLEEEYELEPAPETGRLVEELLSRSEPNGPVPSGTGKGVEVPSRIPPDPAPDIPPQADQPPLPTARRRRPPRLAMAVGMVVLGFLGVFGLSWGSRSSSSSGGAGAHVPSSDLADLSGPSFHDRRIVVAPFENLTGDPVLGVVGRAAADWTAQALMSTGMVEVVSPSEVLRNALAFEQEAGRGSGSGMAMELAEVTRSRILVSGSYLPAGDGTLVFQTRITDAQEGTLLRAVEQVDGATDDLPAALEPLRQRIIGSLATVVDPRLASWSGAASQPPSFEAYRLYEEGLDRFFQREYADAAHRLRRAWSLDTTFTVPLIWAAFAHQNDRDRESADTVISSLLAQRETMAPWDRAMTDYLDAKNWDRQDWDAAVEAAERVVRYAPDSEWLYKLGYAAMHAWRPQEAVDALSRIDPDRGWMKEWGAYWNVLARTHYALGNYEQALRAIRIRQDRFGESPLTHELVTRLLVGLGELDQATDTAFQRLFEPASGSPVPWFIGQHIEEMALEMRLHGHEAEADALARRALRRFEELPDSVRSDPWGRHGHARLLVQAGQLERAREMFEILVDEAEVAGDWLLHLFSLGREGALAARGGDHVRAQEILEWLTTPSMSPDPDHPRMHQRFRFAALIATALGNPEQAIRFWRIARSNGMTYRLFRIEAQPLFDHPAMQDLAPLTDGTG